MKTKILILFAAIFIAQLYLASALTISSAISNPNQIQPGQQIGLDLSIKNDLNNDVNNVAVSLNLNGLVQQIGTSQQIIYPAVPFSPYQSSNQKVIDSISSDDHESVHFDLTANSDAPSGTYSIPITATYTLDNGTVVPNEQIGVVSIIVNAKPNIVVSSIGPALIKGQSGKITIQVVNSGLGTSNFLSINLGSINGISITNSNNAYIGNINSNDFDTADFNVFVNSNAPSTISIPVEVTYTDSQNNQIVQDNALLVKTYTPKEARSVGLTSGGSAGLIIILIIILIVGFFIYRSVRKRRKNKRNGQ
ncbi:MAG TPA: hypothetical protein VMC80_00015 [Patescibacteria group bacterium]|nr:hypothetical protein [Patescibacteria group bacterium]